MHGWINGQRAHEGVARLTCMALYIVLYYVSWEKKWIKKVKG